MPMVVKQAADTPMSLKKAVVKELICKGKVVVKPKQKDWIVSLEINLDYWGASGDEPGNHQVSSTPEVSPVLVHLMSKIKNFSDKKRGFLF